MKKHFIQNIILGIRHQLTKLTRNEYSKIGLSIVQVKNLKHLPRNKIRRVKLFDSYFYFKNGRELIGGLEELHLHEIYKQKLPENAVIYDCGAHIGLSVLYLKRLCPSAILTAFEPDKNNFDLLSQNVTSYKLTNVTLENKAVWNDNTILNFAGDDDMSSHITTNEDNNIKASYQVPAVRLRDYLIKKVDFLKIDIEGAEYAVLKDVEDKLFLVNNFFLEYHGNFSDSNKLSEIFNILSNNGFQYYISEAMNVYKSPFYRDDVKPVYDVQLNIFCFR